MVSKGGRGVTIPGKDYWKKIIMFIPLHISGDHSAGDDYVCSTYLDVSVGGKLP